MLPRRFAACALEHRASPITSRCRVTLGGWSRGVARPARPAAPVRDPSRGIGASRAALPPAGPSICGRGMQISAGRGSANKLRYVTVQSTRRHRGCGGERCVGRIGTGLPATVPGPSGRQRSGGPTSSRSTCSGCPGRTRPPGRVRAAQGHPGVGLRRAQAVGTVGARAGSGWPLSPSADDHLSIAAAGSPFRRLASPRAAREAVGLSPTERRCLCAGRGVPGGRPVRTDCPLSHRQPPPTGCSHAPSG